MDLNCQMNMKNFITYEIVVFYEIVSSLDEFNWINEINSLIYWQEKLNFMLTLTLEEKGFFL